MATENKAPFGAGPSGLGAPLTAPKSTPTADIPGSAESALRSLRRNVRRLCEVRYAEEPAVARKAWDFYAALPPADGDDFADFLAEEVRIYAAQFGPCGTVPKRPGVTAALEEAING